MANAGWTKIAARSSSYEPQHADGETRESSDSVKWAEGSSIRPGVSAHCAVNVLLMK